MGCISGGIHPDHQCRFGLACTGEDMADKKRGTAKPGMDRDAIIALTRRMEGGKTPKFAPEHESRSQLDAGVTDFSTLAIYQQMETQRAVAELAGLSNPFFRPIEGRAGPEVQIGEAEFLNFASYDYLGLNGHADVASAAKAAIDRYGTSVSASRVTAGSRPVHRELEQRLAGLYNSEDALTFVSGHSTNVSTIGDLMGRRDLILFDAYSHNSITVGAKLSGAARRTYGHNDLDELDKILTQIRNRYDRVLIVVEGLYSMDGDVADLPRLIEIKNRHGAWLMVDEAHALGVLGKSGRGVFEHFDADPGDVDIWMGTLSKTLSGCGGYIAAKKTLVQILRFQASGFMFSVGMPPPVAAASLRALEIMLAEPGRVARLHDNGRFFLKTAQAAGLDTGLSEGFSIVPVIVGDSLRAGKLSNLLMESGVFTVPVTYPAVPMQGARIRFFITSEHKTDQLQAAIDVTARSVKRLADDNFGLASIIDNAGGR